MNTQLKRVLRTLLFVAACAAAVWLALPRPPLLDGVSFSQCVRDRNGKVLRITLTSDQKFRIRTALRDISRELIEATLRYEDKYFWRHPGVNPIALGRSVFGLMRGGPHTGASTITMQLARLRFHLQTRTLTGKFNQIVRALEIERHYSKDEILEAYLNLAPYGRNIEGIGAASEIYFGKSAAHLTGPESIALSMIPQSPSRRALFVDRENGALDSALAQFARRDHNSLYEFRPRALTEREFRAPHFVQQVLTAKKSEPAIVTTLDLDRQRLIERRIAGYVRTNRNRGIQNAAAMLVDSRTMDMLAQIGSADFCNAEIQGQVDGTRSPRSPGSTLKPFVYALALDQGLIHPLSILADAPRSFGDYNPENFDREFLGPIRASDALARSRNLPAVELASELSHPTFYEFLRGAGVPLSRSEPIYGLTLPLGGAEISMENLVTLYSALANHGDLRPLRRVSSDPIAARRQRLVSPEAAFLTLEMLNQPRMICADSGRTAPVFWKTGTSHGFRDAWSVAVFNHYVLAVWVGNFDGRANPNFIGRSAAAPLLFQIIDSLRATWSEPNEQHLPPEGANLKRVEFCAVSGDLPGPFCTHRVEGWFIPGISPIKTCDVHREVLVDAVTGLRVPIDDGSRILRREIYEFWPSEFMTLFTRAGLPRKLPPPFLPGVGAELVARNGNPPRIISPSGEHEIMLATPRTIPLQAKADADVCEIYWFAGKTFIGKAHPQDVLAWKAAQGSYELIALDDHGRSTSTAVTVQ